MHFSISYRIRSKRSLIFRRRTCVFRGLFSERFPNFIVLFFNNRKLLYRQILGFRFIYERSQTFCGSYTFIHHICSIQTLLIRIELKLFNWFGTHNKNRTDSKGKQKFEDVFNVSTAKRDSPAIFKEVKSAMLACMQLHYFQSHQWHKFSNWAAELRITENFGTILLLPSVHVHVNFNRLTDVLTNRRCILTAAPHNAMVLYSNWNQCLFDAGHRIINNERGEFRGNSVNVGIFDILCTILLFVR